MRWRYTICPPIAEDEPLSKSRLAQMHAIDHLMRLQSRLDPPASMRQLLRSESMQPALTRSRDVLELAAAGLRGLARNEWRETMEHAAVELAALRQRERLVVLRKTVASSPRAVRGSGYDGHDALAGTRELPHLAHLQLPGQR